MYNNENDKVYYPKDEMNTVLLPVTLGCSYNNCAFCSMYKDSKYLEVPFSEIKMHLINGYKYTEKVFLTGADPMSIGFEKMEKLLRMIGEYFPYCACVASYASIFNISKYSVDQLSRLHKLGLRLLYIGFETGRDDVLKFMKKKHRLCDALNEAQKLNQSKLSFDTIIMYGIGGHGKGENNGLATANMINTFKTRRVITMNLMVFNGTYLEQMIEKGYFIPADKTERLKELAVLIRNLKCENSMIFDMTHPTNIIKIKGVLPQDREKLINKLKI